MVYVVLVVLILILVVKSGRDCQRFCGGLDRQTVILGLHLLPFLLGCFDLDHSFLLLGFFGCLLGLLLFPLLQSEIHLRFLRFFLLQLCPLVSFRRLCTCPGGLGCQRFLLRLGFFSLLAELGIRLGFLHEEISFLFLALRFSLFLESFFPCDFALSLRSLLSLTGLPLAALGSKAFLLGLFLDFALFSLLLCGDCSLLLPQLGFSSVTSLSGKSLLLLLAESLGHLGRFPIGFRLAGR